MGLTEGQQNSFACITLSGSSNLNFLTITMKTFLNDEI